MPPTLNDPRQHLHDAEADARLGEGLEAAGWRLRGGFQEASRRLERRLGGEEAGTEASSRRGGFHRILFGIGTQNDVK